MGQSRRPILQKEQPGPTTHAGLWLDKYIDQLDVPDDNKAENILVRQVAKISETDLYQQFFGEWKETLTRIGAKTEKARVIGRLAVNLGAESVLETDIALHHTYGMPYIPGSALKGLAAFYARNHLNQDEWGELSKVYRIMFGDGDYAGFITFFDALYIPGSGFKRQALWPDIITTHHPDYYQGKEDAAPADWDNPTPINFLTSTGKYLLALSGPKEWVQACFKILELALKELGIGAKTSSGYGRMAFSDVPTASQQPQETYAIKKQRLLDEKPPAMRMRGLVDRAINQGDYGFLNPVGGGRQVFIHRNQLRAPANKVVEGQVLEYTPGKDNKGRPRANDAEILLQPD